MALVRSYTGPRSSRTAIDPTEIGPPVDVENPAGSAVDSGTGIAPSGTNDQLARLQRLQAWRAQHAANAMPTWRNGGLGTTINYDPQMYGSNYQGPAFGENNPDRAPWVGPGPDPRSAIHQPPAAPGGNPSAPGPGALGTAASNPTAASAPVVPAGQPFYPRGPNSTTMPGPNQAANKRTPITVNDPPEFSKFASFRQRNGMRPMRFGVGGV